MASSGHNNARIYDVVGFRTATILCATLTCTIKKSGISFVFLIGRPRFCKPSIFLVFSYFLLVFLRGSLERNGEEPQERSVHSNKVLYTHHT